MTTLFKQELTCCQCSKPSRHTVVMSTSACGPPDLDMRPAEMARSTLPQQVQACPHCGYCAKDISAPAPDASGVMARTEFRVQLTSDEFPELANRFLCAALILESSNRLVEAGWTAVQAAWACDDAEAAGAARHCRLRAESLLGRAVAAGQRVDELPGVDSLIRAELLRRADAFEEATERLQAGLSLNLPDKLRLLLLFETSLIERQDTARHTVQEGLERGPM